MDKNRLRDAARNNIVTIMFIVLCAVCMAFSGYAPNYVLYELFGRLSRNMFIVLSLIIPIVAGMGINFAITIGAMAAQIACLLVLEWGVSGIGGLALAALLTAVYMLRASGALDGLTHLLAPLLTALGVPPETAPLLVIRPLSGSGALAAGSDLMRQYGTDSYIGRCAAVMLGCTETTFYTVAVYFGAAGIRKTRYTVPAALTADAAAFLSAALAVRLFFGQ